MNKNKLRQVFLNNSNCYADTTNDDVTPAMTADVFVEVVSKITNSDTHCGYKDFDNRELYYPSCCDEKPINVYDFDKERYCRFCGKPIKLIEED